MRPRSGEAVPAVLRNFRGPPTGQWKFQSGRQWTCRVSGKDRYGRSLASCHIDGEDIARWMVRSGLALSFRRYSHEYDAEETAAIEARAGLWGGAFIAPWDWRHRNTSTEILGAVSVPIDAQKDLLPAEPRGAPTPTTPVPPPTKPGANANNNAGATADKGARPQGHARTRMTALPTALGVAGGRPACGQARAGKWIAA